MANFNRDTWLKLSIAVREASDRLASERLMELRLQLLKLKLLQLVCL